MTETFPPPSAHIAPTTSTWYRSLSLPERTTAPIPHLDRNAPSPHFNLDLGRRRLQHWQKQPAFKQDDDLAARLALDGLTEADLLALLAESAESLQERISAPLPWLDKLLLAFEDTRGCEDIRLPLEGFDPHHSAFLTILKPLLHHPIRHIQGIIQRVSSPDLPFDPDSLLSLLLIPLLEQLLTCFMKTAVLELNVARVEGRLQGASPEERFQDFIRQMVQQQGILPLLEEYTVLARHLIECIEGWVTREEELLTRLSNDWTEISTTFLSDQHPGQLVEIYEGAGDTNRGGRSVTILIWDSGFHLVYKPRSMAIDGHFQELLIWLNEHGQQPPLLPFTVLNKSSYGWCEFLHATPCTSPAEIERFYLRQGSYLALLYILEAVDFHAENVIAHGEHPMLVDLESLFHPRIQTEKAELPALEMIERSVQRIGLLPQRIWSRGESEGVDISGLGAQPGQMTPEPVARWSATGTDQMQIVRERIEIRPGRNRPTLDGQEINTLDYSATIATGFSTTYRLLMHVRPLLLKEILPRFASDEIRCLFRPTRLYAQLQSDSFHPNVLRDALEYDRLLDRLWIGVEQQPHLRKIIRAEQADLRQRDIPLFTTRVDATALVACDGSIIEDFFAESGLSLAMQRLQQLDEADLERQCWIIQASFASMLLGSDQATQKTLHLRPSEQRVPKEQILAAALAVGDRLDKLALSNEETATWLGLNAIKDREWRLTIAEDDLYSGTAGIALFLAYLGTIAQEERYTVLAHAALKTIRYFFTRKKAYARFSNIGMFSGLGAFIYLLSHLGALWHDATFYAEAAEIVKLLPAAIARDKSFDVIAGSAGCIAALCSLHAVAPSEDILTCAQLCGDHLLACAQTMKKGIGWSAKDDGVPLAGLSHGAAGIALNLLRLFQLTQEQRFKQGALAAINYEHSLFSPTAHNWPDLRQDPSNETSGNEQVQKYMVAWCHGAPGIGLARLATLDILDTPQIRKEIAVALRTTLREGFGLNHSLCHGDLGNMDLLLVAAHSLRAPEYRQAIERLSAMLLDSIDTQGRVTGVPLGIETPGLMTGLAGIGYGLLRLAVPDQVPSVLLGEAPIRS